MEFLFDSANLNIIEEYMAYYPITGVTTNPSILRREGKLDIYAHFKAIRSLIGMDRSLHIQVIASKGDEMVAEARSILQHVDDQVFIKVPSTEQGFKAMRVLKADGYKVTATVILSKLQGCMAILCGADYIAPYCNRMESLDLNFPDTISAFRQMIDEMGSQTRILAASFRDSAQIISAFASGAHAATVQPGFLTEAFAIAAVNGAIERFTADWIESQGSRGMP